VIKQIEAIIQQGAAKSFDEYRFIVGQVVAYRRMIHTIRESEKNREHEEEL
jgi:hypothetical protein